MSLPIKHSTRLTERIDCPSHIPVEMDLQMTWEPKTKNWRIYSRAMRCEYYTVHPIMHFATLLREFAEMHDEDGEMQTPF